MNKIIFLDIDGVLNDINDMKNNIGISKKLFSKAYPKLDYDKEIEYIGLNFFLEKIEILKEVIRRTSAEIVLISSWRSPIVIEALISKDLPVIGMIPYLNQNRGKEIKEYLKYNQCYSFCIIDDEICDYEKEELTDYLVKTEGYNYSGLSYEHIEEIIEILSYKTPFFEENYKKTYKKLINY